MKPTLITGLFDDSGKAEQASELLRKEGFSSKDITESIQTDQSRKQIHNPDWDTSTTAKRDLVTDIAKDLDPELGKLLSTISGENNADSTIAETGHFIVTVQTANLQSAEDAARILDKAGALNVQKEESLF